MKPLTIVLTRAHSYSRGLPKRKQNQWRISGQLVGPVQRQLVDTATVFGQEESFCTKTLQGCRSTYLLYSPNSVLMTIFSFQTWRNLSTEKDMASTMESSLKRTSILTVLANLEKESNTWRNVEWSVWNLMELKHSLSEKTCYLPTVADSWLTLDCIPLSSSQYLALKIFAFKLYQRLIKYNQY